MTPSNRQSELEKMSWMELREVARRYGIEKPEGGGWESTIPMILEFEEKRVEVGENPPAFVPSLELSQAQENIQANDLKATKIQAKNPAPTPELPASLAASASEESTEEKPYKFESTIQSRGATICPKCGDKIHRDRSGKPICSIGDSQCPILQS